MVLVFRIGDKTPEIVRTALLESGWEEWQGDGDGRKEGGSATQELAANSKPETADRPNADWNLYWKTGRFQPSIIKSCNPYQKVNHFPSSSAITKKDNMVKTLRKMQAIYGASAYGFIPESFCLPTEYSKFVKVYSQEEEECNIEKRKKRGVWICKPTDLSRGRKIFLITDISELSYDTPYVIQRYISSPLLIHEYKFDLRIYVLVASYHPLRVLLYDQGLARFGTEKFAIVFIYLFIFF